MNLVALIMRIIAISVFISLGVLLVSAQQGDVYIASKGSIDAAESITRQVQLKPTPSYNAKVAIRLFFGSQVIDVWRSKDNKGHGLITSYVHILKQPITLFDMRVIPTDIADSMLAIYTALPLSIRLDDSLMYDTFPSSYTLSVDIAGRGVQHYTIYAVDNSLAYKAIRKIRFMVKANRYYSELWDCLSPGVYLTGWMVPFIKSKDKSPVFKDYP